jgi:Ca2+-binding RTX toxin-like protein
VGLGDPRTRFVTLLGQSPSETTHNGNDYVEGNGGNDVLYGEDGSDSVHGDTPAPGSPRLDECLPTSDPAAGQDVIVGGYGNDVLCGDGGDDAILGDRGLVGTFNATSGAVAPVPFSSTTQTVGSTSGGPDGTLTLPTSGNTIYPVRLDVEYTNGVLTPVPNWNNPAASGQSAQHDIIFGGQGNDTIHGSPGDDFIQGDDGMHIATQPASTGGDDIIFGGGGNDSTEGGPGNDHVFGGGGNDDADVVRSDTAIAPKVDDAGNCLPIAFPTLTVAPSTLAGNGFCPLATWANTSYASRFPLASGTYDSDPGALDNGGQTSKTKVFGDILYGGDNRDISQSQGTPPGFGDRIIDELGAYNMEFVCPASYGGSQIIRSLSPGMLTFLQQLAADDGAYNLNQTNKPPTTLSSGDVEASIVYPSDVGGNGGSAYPNTAGHFTC